MQTLMSKKKPVTVMLGFYGARPRYLKKYADFVRKLKIPSAPRTIVPTETVHSEVVTYQPPMANLLSRRCADKSSAELADVVRQAWVEPFRAAKHADKSATPAPLIFYLLSNNGAFNFAKYMDTLRKQHPEDYELVQEHTSGIVFDSCPSDPNLPLMVRGVTSVATASAFKKPVSHHPMLSPVFKAALAAVLPFHEQHLGEITDALHNDLPRHAALLYLYSQADSLVMAEETRAHAVELAPRQGAAYHALSQKLKLPSLVLSPESAAALGTAERLGERVFAHDFVDSAHVEHLRTHTPRYTELVRGFYEYATRTN